MASSAAVSSVELLDWRVIALTQIKYPGDAGQKESDGGSLYAESVIVEG
jgi:hypothetical protein